MVQYETTEKWQKENLSIYTWEYTLHQIGLLAWAVEYTDCFSAEG